MGARYYDGEIGKFISADPVFLGLGDQAAVQAGTGQKLQSVLSDPQGLNSYAYARNNPMRLVDPNGAWFKEVLTGQQSFASFAVELGDAGNALYSQSSVAAAAMDHPVATGAVMGAAAGLAYAAPAAICDSGSGL
jgi:RHS repeat-associated protein